MITRIVKMTFKHEELENFMQLFEEVKHKIRNFEGCEGLSLLRDIHQHNVLFTYSHWQSENHLNQYRHSELFAKTWQLTKAKFDSKAEAWSVEQLVGIDNNK